jgi:SHS2 domain-containing protein
MSSSFRFLEDIALADIAFEAEGDSVEALFQGATQALLEIMADPLTVRPAWEQGSIKTEAILEDLLVEWLSEIVYWKDAAGVVFSEAPLTLTHANDRWTLKARLIGAPVDQATQALRNDVKGITRHLFKIWREGPAWKARVVVDV